MVSGKKLVEEFILNHSEFIESVVFTAPIWAKASEIIKSFSSNNLHRFELSSDLFKLIDVLGTNEVILVAQQKQIKEWNSESPFHGLEILCPLSDPQNLGALARSAWALGADRLVLLKESAHPYLPKTWKASAGTIWQIPLFQGPSIQDLTCDLIALDMAGENLTEFCWPKQTRLLLGEEGLGIPKKCRARRLCIPIREGVESLNVAVAGAIAINQFKTSQK